MRNFTLDDTNVGRPEGDINPFANVPAEAWSLHAGKCMGVAADGRGLVAVADTPEAVYELMTTEHGFSGDDDFLVQPVADLSQATADDYLSLL